MSAKENEEINKTVEELNKLSKNPDEVCKYEGIGRFVLGLFEDIEIINSPDFVLYLKEKVQNISEKIQD